MGAHGRFQLNNAEALRLSAEFGTPLYVLSEAHIRQRVTDFSLAIQSDGAGELFYASKANGALAVLSLMHRLGCKIDIASEGELRAALAAGVPAEDINFHGNFKSSSELEFALKLPIGEITIDNDFELTQIAQLKSHLDASQTRFSLRVVPDVDPQTHRRISTGKEDSKFGVPIKVGQAERLLLRAKELGIAISGIHAHVGSQLIDLKAQIQSAQTISSFAVRMIQSGVAHMDRVNLGGGLGIQYKTVQSPVSIGEYVSIITSAAKEAFAEANLPYPTWIHEPGRALIGDCGITLYSVGPIKDVPHADGTTTRYVAVDGGLSDNPRPGFYDAEYDVVWASPNLPAGEQTVKVVGRHCETDDLFDDVPAPASLRSGDICQVLCTGAYNFSMASNYNRFVRPAMVMLRESGEVEIIVKRENFCQLWERESIGEGQ